MASPYATLAATPTTGKESGLADFFLFAAKSEFDTIEKPTTGNTHIATDHTFLTGNGFMKVECAPVKEKLSAQFIGEQGNLKLNSAFECFIPGSNKELHKLISLIKNEQLIILVHDSDCDIAGYYQLGTECTGAYLSADGGFETGTTKDGVKGYKLKFEVPGNKVLTYEGAVTMHP